ncbi:MAG: hypothetical protein QF681_15365 [Vicinamibacterales bacterium]|nr:hypothetical protein [Vicinamibacterales bacterium]
MYRLAIVFTSLLAVATWSIPVDAAEEQGRARRRNPGTSQTQRAPQRTAPSAASAPRRSAPQRRAPSARQPRGGRDGGNARRAVPRRAPRQDTAERGRDTDRERRVAPTANTRGGRRTAPQGSGPGASDGRRRGDRPGTRVIAPRGGGRGTGNTAGVNRPGRQGGRNTRIGRTGDRRGTVVSANRRSPRGRVVGTAVRRPPLRSRPIVVNNYGGRGGVRGYTSYGGRYRYGPSIYGSYFYFPGYSTFNIGIGAGYGSGYGYNPYWNGYYSQAYGYDAYNYGGYGTGYLSGSLRLKVQPRFGEVFVDGYYVGLVNDYDGIFQRLRLEEGPHHIEITELGFETLAFDVLILPGETITYEGYLVPLP